MPCAIPRTEMNRGKNTLTISCKSLGFTPHLLPLVNPLLASLSAFAGFTNTKAFGQGLDVYFAEINHEAGTDSTSLHKSENDYAVCAVLTLNGLAAHRTKTIRLSNVFAWPFVKSCPRFLHTAPRASSGASIRVGVRPVSKQRSARVAPIWPSFHQAQTAQ